MADPRTDIDPRLIAMADDAVRDLMAEVGHGVIEAHKAQYVERLAKAMQQACEQEYGALVEEVTA